MKTSTFTWRKIKTDAKVKFYTGINTIVLFNKIFRLIQTFLSDLIYWKGPKHAKNCSKVSHRRRNTSKKLSQHDEFLLTLMRLRLGLLVREIAWFLHYTDAGKILPLKICGSVIGSTHRLHGICIFLKKEGKWKHLPCGFKIYRQDFIANWVLRKKYVILIGISFGKTKLLSSKPYRYQLVGRSLVFFSIKNSNVKVRISTFSRLMIIWFMICSSDIYTICLVINFLRFDHFH